MKPIDEVLKYQNDEVVIRFSKETGASLEDARDIFLETKRWLWLCASSQGKPVNMVGEAFVIDEMWHTFLLFTRDYTHFCQTHFGEFIHHVPKKSTELSGALDPSSRLSLRGDYELIYDKLGPEVLVKWCQTYPARYAQLRPKDETNIALPTT